MKLAIVRGGGIGGLSTRTEVSSERLSPADATTLADKVEQAGVMTMPEPPLAGPLHPDELLYALEVEDRGRARTLRFSEGTLPEPVRGLVAWVDSRPERQDRVGSLAPGTTRSG